MSATQSQCKKVQFIQTMKEKTDTCVMLTASILDWKENRNVKYIDNNCYLDNLLNVQIGHTQ